MPEAAAGEALAKNGIMSLADYGVAILVIVILFGILYKFGLKWIASAEEREKRDREVRKSTYEALDGLTRSTDRQTVAMERLVAAVGDLPCTHRDPALRTRASDNRVREAIEMR